MRAFPCAVCGNLLFFENTTCLRCGSPVGYVPELRTMLPLDRLAEAHVRCDNSERAGCNWLVPGSGGLCAACALTRTRPDDGDLDEQDAFRMAEAAKRRLVFQRDELGLAHPDGPPLGWEQTFVSGYAAAHPWEDWAESFAHYLHVRDTLQTAASFGVIVAGPDLPPRADDVLASMPTADGDDFDELIATWLPLTMALNVVNRSMGKDDL